MTLQENPRDRNFEKVCRKQGREGRRKREEGEASEGEAGRGRTRQGP